MKSLVLNKHSAVIFLEEDETDIVRELTEPDELNVRLKVLLRSAGISLPGGELYLEIFENGGRSVLFISEAEHSRRECEIFRFNRLDDLLAAVDSVKHTVTFPERSSLYCTEKHYFLALYPPFAFNAGQLSEYGSDAGGSEYLLAYLSEHGKLLSSPSALTELTRYF